MSNHTVASLLVFAWAVSLLLAAVDDQPKPCWTGAYIARTVISLGVTVPLFIVLIVRAW